MVHLERFLYLKIELVFGWFLFYSKFTLIHQDNVFVSSQLR